VLIIVLTIPMSVGIIHAVRTFGKFAEGQVQKKVESDLTHLLTIYENKQRQVETLAKSVAMDNAVKVTASLGKESLLGQRLEDYLTKFLKKDIIDLLIITDEQAEVITRQGTLELKDDHLSENEILKRALNGELTVSSYLVSKEKLRGEKSRLTGNTNPTEKNFNQLLIILAACPLNYNEKTVGVVMAGCFLNDNASLKKEMEEESDFALLQKEHTVLTNLRDKEGNLLIGKSIHLPRNENGGEEIKHRGKVAIGVREYLYRSFPILDIEGKKVATLIALQDVDTIRSIKTETIRGMALILVLGLALALLLVVVVGYHFTKPLKKLAERTETIAKGDLYSPIIEVRSKDEIGVLASSFSRMTASLREAHDELEQRVKDRTRELEREIGEREKAEEGLRLFAAKLEQSNRELEDFASVASHDLQEPLRKVRAFGDRLKAVCGEEFPEKGRDYLERMQSAAGRMQILIEDLLTFSRVTTRAKPFVTVELEQIAREVLSDLEVTIEQLGGRVELGKLPVIGADPLQMRQILQNLVSNGLKFHKKGESPVVKVYCELDNERYGLSGTSSDDKSLQLVVEDNGIGFDEKYLDKIFGIFQRLHSRSEFEGTGVGLAVCRKIAKRHGGDITAKSTPGQGAKFIVTLPLKQLKGEEHEERARRTDYDLVGRG